MREIEIPHNGWRPRDYQQPFWDYMSQGGMAGKHAELIWHRRAGKDECMLHLGAKAMTQRSGTYWHMLPLANQVRKAIWESVNPHTGKRRIYEAFPLSCSRSGIRTCWCVLSGAMQPGNA